MDFLIVGTGMLGAAAARYLAPHAQVTAVGPEAPADGSKAYGAHDDEGRIISRLSSDPLWSELSRLARAGMTELDPALITACGVLAAASDRGPGHSGTAGEASARSGPGIRTLTPAEARAAWPMIQFPGEAVRYQPDGGHFSPRRYVSLAMQEACAQGARIVTGTVRGLRSAGRGSRLSWATGVELRADTAVVATGAFAAGSGLLPVPVALRAKSEIYLMAEVDDRQAAELHAMPCVICPVAHPRLADIYMLPPIRYPDGHVYLKIGANTIADRWLPDPAAVRAWYRYGDDAELLPDLREALTALLPGLRARSWHTRRCADAYTARYRPYIGALAPGVIAVLGGNGRGAQAADALGQLAARLALTGEWPPGLPRDEFRPVPGPGAWTGMTLLRDRARGPVP